MRKEIDFFEEFTRVQAVKAIEINEGIYVFNHVSYNLKNNPDGSTSTFNLVNRQGLAALDDIESVQKDVKKDLPFFRTKIEGVKESLPVKLMTSEMIDNFSKLDFWSAAELVQKEGITSFDFVDKLNDSEISKLLLVAFDSSSHMIFGLNGVPFPCSIGCNYIERGFRSEVYELEGLHAHLKARKDIFKLSKIELIPYYNNESGHEKAISFRIVPDPKLFAEAWRMAVDAETEYPSTRVAEIYIRNLDGIGANQFLKQNA